MNRSLLRCGTMLETYELWKSLLLFGPNPKDDAALLGKNGVAFGPPDQA